ncbi:MAG: type II CRISPR-associated endonuclease Cas1 [Burkholderiaceae bacterium]
MVGRVVEIANDRCFLSKHRGFLVVRGTGDDRREIGRVPLDDVAVLIANAHGISYTNSLLVALAQAGTPVILCADNHNVAGCLLPISGNHEQAKRFDAQWQARLPLRKRLWASIVRQKLLQQASVVSALGAPSRAFEVMARKVRSGDPENIEAQAARRYWPLLFGADFRRDRERDGVNAMLNYGYAVFRAATARAVVAAGLHPTIGLHHSNGGNPLRLVDDLIEPFRPLIDWKVRELHNAGVDTVDSDTKRALATCLYIDLNTVAGRTPVSVAMQNLATSLAQVFLGERRSLLFPDPGTAEQTEASEC